MLDPFDGDVEFLSENIQVELTELKGNVEYE